MPFNSWSALFTKLFKLFSSLKLFCFVSQKEKSSWVTVIMTLIWHFFHCHQMVSKRSETVDLSITLSNSRMFWNSFCLKVRSGVGVEPILTRKHASLPQNLLCHNSLRQTKNFRTVENILWIYSSSQGSSSLFNIIAYLLLLLFVFRMDYDTRN